MKRTGKMREAFLGGMFALLLVGPAVAQDCVEPPDDLVSWYPGDGNAFDIQGGNDGTLQNGATFAPGMVEQAFSLDGANDFVSLGNPASLKLTGSLTIDAWIKPNDFPAGDLKGVVVKWGQNFSQCGPGTPADSYALYLQKAGSIIRPIAFIHRTDLGEPGLSGGSTPAGVFSHVAMTYDATTGFFALYVNGVQVASSSLSPLGLCTSEKNVLIGAEDVGPTSRHFPGQIDEVEIFDRALSAQEIADIYNAGSAGKCRTCTPPPSSMVSWYRAEGDATDFQDGNDGALQGTVSFPFAKVGLGFGFDGNDDRVVVPHNSDLDVQTPGFTADFWMNGTKTQPDTTFATVLEKSHGFIDLTGWVFQATKSDGKITFGMGDSSNGTFPVITSTVDVLDGNSHHITGTWDGSAIRLYVDGALQGSQALTTPANNNRELNIGFTWGGGTPQRFFRGLIDEVEIFNRALTAAEIAAIVDAGNAGKCIGPAAVCGNGTVEGSETCDDGNTLSGDCCSATCQFESTATVCGDASAECATPDTCDGAGTCTDNGFKASGTACGDPTDTACNNPDTCDGSGSCQVNLVAANTSCGDLTATECNNADTCDGVGSCQPNLAAAGTACGNAGSACVNQDTCDGAGACADNGFRPSGTACGDGTDTNCNNPDTCNGSGSCQVNLEPNGTACSDGNACTSGDVCSGGACNGGAPLTCNDNNNCTTDACTPASGCTFKALTCQGQPATLCGTSRNDTLIGTPGADVILGREGNDRIEGGDGNDRLCGGNGRDTLQGGKGNDQVFGEEGNDTLDGGAGTDNCNGGPGQDSATACEQVKNVP